MRLILVTMFLFIVSFSSLSQDIEKKTYGGISYSVHNSKSTDREHTFQTIELNEGVSLYSILVKMISGEKIETYKMDDGFLTVTNVNDIALGFVTYEGYTACPNVIRDYVQVVISGDKDAEALIQKDEFTKVMTCYNQGKHLSMIKSFLYNTEFSVIPRVFFLSE